MLFDEDLSHDNTFREFYLDGQSLKIQVKLV